MKNLNLIHLNGLRAAEAVARNGSLPAAAGELSVSVGAVSQQIIKVEHQLGLQLFTRTARGMVATEAGQPVLARLGEGFRHLSGAVGLALKGDDKVLTISVAPVFAARWLVHRISSFSDRFPDIRLRLDANDRLVDPATSDVDLCIRVGRGNWPGTRSELLREQRIFPVCSPALGNGLKTRDDILALPAVIDARAMFEWSAWLAEVGLAGRTMQSRLSFSEASLCLDAALAGQGVFLGWETIASHHLQQGQLTAPFSPAVKTGFSHYFVTSMNARRSEKVETFKRWLRAELEEDMTKLASSVPFLASP